MHRFTPTSIRIGIRVRVAAVTLGLLAAVPVSGPELLGGLPETAGSTARHEPAVLGDRPPVGRLLDSALAKMRGYRTVEALRSYSYTHRTVHHVLDDDGGIEERRVERARVAPIRHRNPASRGEPRHEDRIEIDEELVGRYRWEVTGARIVDGRRTWTLSFEPRVGRLPERTRFDRALNVATGSLWIDADERQLVHVEARLRESVRFWGGILGSISEFRYELDRRRLPSGAWVPVRRATHARTRVLLRTTHERTIETWSDFDPADPPEEIDVPDDAGTQPDGSH